MKSNKLKILFRCFASSFAVGFMVMNLSNSAYAKNFDQESSNSVDVVVLFDELEIDNNIEAFIENEGGTIISEMPQVGGLKVRCSKELMDSIGEMNGVESLFNERIIRIKDERKIKFKSSMNVKDDNRYYNDSSNIHYEDNSNGYYNDNGNSYYEDNRSSYYNDSGNSYYEDNSNGYYDNSGNSYYEDNSNGYYDEETESDDMFSGNLFEKYQWDIKRVTDNGRSFYIERGNHNVVVGIIDSGVDTDHPDISKNFLGGMNFVPENFMDDNSENGDIYDVEDRFGHGTNVAGQIAADGKSKGIAPGIGFKSYRVFNKDGETSASICAAAIIQAVNDKVDVINLSINGYYLNGKIYDKNASSDEYEECNEMADYYLLKRAVQYAVENDVVVVSASGNEGLDCSDKDAIFDFYDEIYGSMDKRYEGEIYQAPGIFDGVINVSATDKNDKISCYSNYGHNIIDVAAPAGDITGEFDNMCMTTDIDNGYTFSLGTSLSAPKVSALAGLILCRNKNMRADQIEKIIYKSADKIQGDNTEDYYGAGIMNVCKALDNMNMI